MTPEEVERIVAPFQWSPLSQVDPSIAKRVRRFAENIFQYEGAPTWSHVAMVRYRSRSDFLEATSSPVFLEHALRNGV